MEYELSDIISDHLRELKVTSHQYNVLNHIIDCRTAFMGGHLLGCSNPECDHTENLYNSCCDRNCPKCQSGKQLKWKNNRNNDLLPVDYLHMTFTIPRVQYEIFRYNKKVCYSVFFKSINEAIKEHSGNSKVGFILIIHTWTQLGNYHPHIHCALPEVKVENDNISAVKYSINKENLNIVFKRILLKNMIAVIKKGSLEHPDATEEILNKSLKNSKNYLYMKRTNSVDIINYLGNFTNKIAITNDRIKAYDGQDVTFSYIDRTDGNKENEMKIDAVLFLKRFILHILPYKLTKTRYYGFMANNSKKLFLKLKTQLIVKFENIKNKEKNSKIILRISLLVELLKAIPKCPICKTGLLEMKYRLSPVLSP